jgi:hypothetical protein
MVDSLSFSFLGDFYRTKQEKMQFHIMQVTETKIEKLKLIISE